MGKRRTIVLSFLNLNPRKFGSIEEFTLVLSRRIGEQGGRSILAFNASPPDNLKEAFRNSGAVIEVFPATDSWMLLKSVWQMIRRYRPGVVHFHFFDQYSWLPLVSWLAGASLIVFTDHYRFPQSRAMTRLKCKLWDRVVLRSFGIRVLAVSEHVKRVLCESYGAASQSIQVILNGVNPNRFGAGTADENLRYRQALNVPAGKRMVIAAAYLIPEKGIGDLVRAAKDVTSTRPNTVFVIVGDGPLHLALREQARQLGISEAVRFTGLRSDVHRLMAAADIVAVPSVCQEAAGLVVIEGMASARPVIATRVGGIPEYLKEGECGLLVEPGSPTKLAEALGTLLDDSMKAAAMGAAGRARVEKFFSLERWVAETMAIYAEAQPQQSNVK